MKLEMTALEWAARVAMLDALGKNIQYAREVKVTHDPSALVLAETANELSCGGPSEVFSPKSPIWSPPEPADESLRPIDKLYGAYFPERRRIEIYYQSIQRDAGLFNSSVRDIVMVVRIHEYAHAVVHLGIRSDESHSRLSQLRGQPDREWEPFLQSRNDWFVSLSEGTHELLAQAITYSCLEALNDAALMRTYENMEMRQPPHYVLPSEAKQRRPAHRWQLILEAVRGANESEATEKGFTLRDGVMCFLKGTPNQAL